MKKVLQNYRVQTQLLANWCWAAVASSVSVNYNRNSRWSQADIAAALIAPACRYVPHGTGYPPHCDSPMDLRLALRKTGNFAPGADRPLSLPEIISQINAGWPVCCQIKWEDRQGSHFVVIYGYHNSWLFIGDPEPGYGALNVPYNQFTYGYRGGRWLRTICTTPYIPI